MSFADEIYPYRTNRIEFLRRLLNKVDRDWTEVVPIPISIERDQRPGGAQRCRHVRTGFFSRAREVCNPRPQQLDKTRVRSLLKGWQTPDLGRYLDLETLQNLIRLTSYTVLREAFDRVKQNASQGGAVRFLQNELENCRHPHFFGPQLWSRYDYNTYFSHMLRWDDAHCYGVLLQMNRANKTGNAVTIYQAALDWIRYQVEHRKGVYQFYHIQFQSRLHPF